VFREEAFVPERSQFPLSLELALGTAQIRRRGVLAARRLGGFPGVVAAWLGWALLVVIVVVRALSSSSSSSSPGPTLSYTISLQYLYTTHLQKPNLSPFCCMNTTFIPSFSCIPSRTDRASFFLKIYLSIYLSSSGFFAFLLWVFDPRNLICILVQI
jgi:hypothetical protein